MRKLSESLQTMSSFPLGADYSIQAKCTCEAIQGVTFSNPHPPITRKLRYMAKNLSSHCIDVTSGSKKPNHRSLAANEKPFGCFRALTAAPRLKPKCSSGLQLGNLKSFNRSATLQVFSAPRKLAQPLAKMAVLGGNAKESRLLMMVRVGRQ